MKFSLKRKETNPIQGPTNMYEIAKVTSEDSKKTHSKYEMWKYTLPLPPQSLIESVGGPSIENFYIVGESWSMVSKHLLKASSTVLEVGCGCGKATRHFLLNDKVKKYIGFDVMKESIDWCNNFIKPFVKEEYEFHFADIQSDIYNPNGKIQLEDYKFPAKDSTVDLVIAGSLFTHLKEPHFAPYLRETSRVLKKGGHALLSIHDEPKEGKYSGNESRADMDPDYFKELAKKEGLSVKEDIGYLCGQRTIIFEK